MNRLIAIIWNTFRETIRDKILYNLLIFSLLLIGSTMFLQNLTVAYNRQVMDDLGLAFTGIFGTMIAIFVGIGLVYKEIDRRTIYTIVSKPIPRYKFLLGKFLGLQLTLLFNVAVMTVLMFATSFLTFKSVHWYLLWAIAFLFIELMVIASIAMMFSTFTTPTLSAIFTLSFWLTGHLVGDMRQFAMHAKDISVIKTFYILTRIFPDLERFNLKSWATYGDPLDYKAVLLSVALGLGYSVFFLGIAALIFQRRDFK